MAASTLATGTPSDALDRTLSAEKPSRVPPAILTKPAVNAYLRHLERRAGPEL